MIHTEGPQILGATVQNLVAWDLCIHSVKKCCLIYCGADKEIFWAYGITLLHISVCVFLLVYSNFRTV
jgi:hypothetical protein